MTAPPVTQSWAHQVAAFQFVERLWKAGRRGAMLAMAMGCGKSKVLIDLALAFQLRLILILCPLRVVEVWRGQFARFAPGAYTFGALDDQIGSVREKTARAKELLTWSRERQQPLVLAINYESARTEPFASWSLANAWSLTALDESHRLKDPSGRTSKYCSRLAYMSHHRLCLTGTPMPHAPIDIWSQFRFLDRSILDPTFGSFKLRHAVMGGYFNKEITGWRDLDELHAQFSRIAFRVDERVLDLPPEMDETLSASLSAEGARVYRQMEKEMLAWIGSGAVISAANAMVRLLRLQQITGGSLADEQGREHHIDSTKENLLADLLDDLDPAEPVVVFARFKPDIAAIHRAAHIAGRNSGELSGDRDTLGCWQKGGQSVLAVQIQAGGVGIDLTRARIGVYYSIGFSLADYLQSRSRIRRPPQARPCAFYHLQIRNSIDQGVLRAVLARQDLIESVLKELKDHVHRTEYPGR